MPDEHRCPRRTCHAVVPNRLFACAADWALLSATAQRGIYRTARLSLLSVPRREAIQVALDEWKVLDEAHTDQALHQPQEARGAPLEGRAIPAALPGAYTRQDACALAPGGTSEE